MAKKLITKQQEELLQTLKSRFEKHPERHQGTSWADVLKRVEAAPDKLWALFQMEETGGEPDVVGFDDKSGKYLFVDCSAESPKNRRSLCYDHEALESRKKHKPDDSAVSMATKMGVELLTEEQYMELQQLGDFDLKTSSWLHTPGEIRKLGGAIFGDKRFGRTFIYHNGAESYYGARGFRGALYV